MQPICGPPVFFCPALKCWIPPKQQVLCSHTTHLWATCRFVVRFEAWGRLGGLTPRMPMGMSDAPIEVGRLKYGRRSVLFFGTIFFTFFCTPAIVVA